MGTGRLCGAEGVRAGMKHERNGDAGMPRETVGRAERQRRSGLLKRNREVCAGQRLRNAGAHRLSRRRRTWYARQAPMAVR